MTLLNTNLLLSKRINIPLYNKYYKYRIKLGTLYKPIYLFLSDDPKRSPLYKPPPSPVDQRNHSPEIGCFVNMDGRVAHDPIKTIHTVTMITMITMTAGATVAAAAAAAGVSGVAAVACVSG